jgi:hypothetical protein
MDVDCDTKWMEVTNAAGPEVHTPVFMKSSVFWDIMSFSPVNVN